MDKTSKIRALNDGFRTSLGGGADPLGKVIYTRGIMCLPDHDILHVLRNVANYAEFTEDNDPYDQHDFGSFLVRGQRIFWKIDYYDARYEYGSSDPSDATITRRGLTVLLAEEY